MIDEKSGEVISRDELMTRAQVGLASTARLALSIHDTVRAQRNPRRESEHYGRALANTGLTLAVIASEATEGASDEAALQRDAWLAENPGDEERYEVIQAAERLRLTAARHGIPFEVGAINDALARELSYELSYSGRPNMELIIGRDGKKKGVKLKVWDAICIIENQQVTCDPPLFGRSSLRDGAPLASVSYGDYHSGWHPAGRPRRATPPLSVGRRGSCPTPLEELNPPCDSCPVVLRSPGSPRRACWPRRRPRSRSGGSAGRPCSRTGGPSWSRSRSTGS